MGTIRFIMVAILWIFGIDGLKSESVTDFNFHDTYYVIANIHLIVLIVPLTFFGVYLIRMLRWNFKNLMANLIFMVANTSLIFIITFLSSLVFGARVTPNMGSEMSKNTGNVWDMVYCSLLIVQLILIIILTISGIKTGQNYRLNTK